LEREQNKQIVLNKDTSPADVTDHHSAGAIYTDGRFKLICKQVSGSWFEAHTQQQQASRQILQQNRKAAVMPVASWPGLMKVIHDGCVT